MELLELGFWRCVCERTWLNVLNGVVGSRIIQLEDRTTSVDSSNTEGCVSDCSEVLHTQTTASQEEKRLCQEKMFKLFLQQTKSMKSPDLEQHFQDKLSF